MIIGLTYLLIRKIEFRRQLYNMLKVKRSFLTLVIEEYTRLNTPSIIITNSGKTNKQILKHCFLKVAGSLNTSRNWKRLNVWEKKPTFDRFWGQHSVWVVECVSLRPHEWTSQTNKKLQPPAWGTEGKKEKWQGLTIVLLTSSTSWRILENWICEILKRQREKELNIWKSAKLITDSSSNFPVKKAMILYRYREFDLVYFLESNNLFPDHVN